MWIWRSAGSNRSLGVGNQWLAVIGLVLLGFGVITGVAKTRRRDAPAASEPSNENNS